MSLSFEVRERLTLLGVLVAALVPFVPIAGSSLFDWMSQYTVDDIGPYRSGYVLTFFICWMLCLVPMLAWTLLANRRVDQGKVDAKNAALAMSPTPTLADLRLTFHAGMSKDDFFAACDSLLERFGGLRVGAPAASETLISLAVAEGDVVLFFLTDGALTYAEYRGGIFLGE